MRYLSPPVQDWQRIRSMKSRYGVTIAKLPEQTAGRERTAGFGSEPLEVNVVFTDPVATTAALKFAESCAQDLGACIRLRAAIVVPMRLPLDQPQISVRFTEQRLSDLACQLERDAFQLTVHLYICRSWVGTLLKVLTPHSLVVIGGQEHWWPTATSRMTETLRAKGHRVVFVDPRELKGICDRRRTASLSAGGQQCERYDAARCELASRQIYRIGRDCLSCR
jgi:hypothetical protein